MAKPTAEATPAVASSDAPKRYYEVKVTDSNKLRAVVKLLEEHALYKNLSLAQIEALKEIVQFVRELPAAFDEAAPIQTPIIWSQISTKTLKEELARRGYGVHKAAEEA